MNVSFPGGIRIRTFPQTSFHYFPCLLCAVVFVILVSFPLAAEAGKFDADRVIRDATTQCDFGPRIPGTSAHEQTKAWIQTQLNALGMKVDVQPFEANLALTAQRAQAWNFWALPVSNEAEPLILFTAHWDTRPFADQDTQGSNGEAFPGANDGAASVAFILELVRSFKGTLHEGRIAVAFFDAEDSGVQRDMDSWCLGSQYGAEHPPEWMTRVTLGINLDMIASRNLELRREGWSEESAPGAMDRLWKIGGDLAPRTFINEPRPRVMDDHVPFVRKGYPFIDLIGLPNPTWHRRSDTPENLDARSIGAVGRVLLEFLGQEMK